MSYSPGRAEELLMRAGEPGGLDDPSTYAELEDFIGRRVLQAWPRIAAFGRQEIEASVLIALVLRAAVFDPARGTPQAFLGGIIRNVGLAWLKKHNAHSDRRISLDRVSEELGSHSRSDHPDTTELDRDHHAIMILYRVARGRPEIVAMLDRLKDGQSCGEIAEALGVEVNTIHKRISRLRKKALDLLDAFPFD